MRKPQWYVVQVETGRENKACDQIARACKGTELISEVFAPRYQTQFKKDGEWHDEERLLLPGYVVVVTTKPWELARVMYNVPGFTRILTQGETYAPLSDDDRQWIERWSTEGDRTIPMSVAYKEGDTLVVTSGPLKGFEFMITRVKRRQSVAEIEMHAGLITVKSQVGLAVLSRQYKEKDLLFGSETDSDISDYREELIPSFTEEFRNLA